MGLRGELGRARARFDEAMAAEVVERERAQRDIVGLAEIIRSLGTDNEALSRALGELRTQLDELQLRPRLARLERERRADVGSGPQAPVAANDDRHVVAPSRGGFDYLAFEARFRGSEAAIQERQRHYVEVLRGCTRVVDLGCGRGELVGLLNENGISAYGVDAEPDFIELLRERGLDAELGDLFSHLEALAPGAVDGIVISHVVEHLDGNEVNRLIQRASDVLQNGGVLVVETPNPESLVAGSINFHRDPTHVRPIHPDTLKFMADSAGFDDVEVHRLSPVDDQLLLPTVAASVDGADQLNTVVSRLNELLFGFQDYAIVARRRAG